MKFLLKIYNGIKYFPESKMVTKISYKEVISLEVKTIPEEEVYEMGFDETDPFDEYVIFHFSNGAESTFRNSYVDVFRT